MVRGVAGAARGAAARRDFERALEDDRVRRSAQAERHDRADGPRQTNDRSSSPTPKGARTDTAARRLRSSRQPAGPLRHRVRVAVGAIGATVLYLPPPTGLQSHRKCLRQAQDAPAKGGCPYHRAPLACNWRDPPLIYAASCAKCSDDGHDKTYESYLGFVALASIKLWIPFVDET